MPDNAVIYARFSPRNDPDESKSIELQVNAAINLCQQRQWTIISPPFVDRAKSGKSIIGRDALEQALDRCEKTKSTLVFWKLDRLARDAMDANLILKRLKRAKCDLCSVSEPFDTTHPAGILFYDLMAAVAGFERAVIAERTSQGMRYRQENGERMTHPDYLPFGQMVDPNDHSRWVENPDEMSIVRMIKNRLGRKHTQKEIREYLNQNNYLNRGKPWQYRGMKKVIDRYVNE